jgi:hypothetical protein
MTNKPRDPIIYANVVATIKARVNRWPSAYASGMVVKEYKRIMYLEGREPYELTKTKQMNPLTRWFREKWINIGTGQQCGRTTKTQKDYPTCRPSVKISKQTPLLANELSDTQKTKLIKNKSKSGKKSIVFPRKRHL